MQRLHNDIVRAATGGRNIWGLSGPTLYYVYNAMMRRIATIFFLFLSTIALAQDIATHEPGIWSIAPTTTMKRWIIIHNLKLAKESGIFHIEVVGRNNGDAAWQVKHLVPHMAITAEALKKSVIEPLNKGAVYPETFDDAYSNWLKENNGAGGSVCVTSVLECMQ